MRFVAPRTYPEPEQRVRREEAGCWFVHFSYNPLTEAVLRLAFTSSTPCLTPPTCPGFVLGRNVRDNAAATNDGQQYALAATGKARFARKAGGACPIGGHYYFCCDCWDRPSCCHRTGC